MGEGKEFTMEFQTSAGTLRTTLLGMGFTGPIIDRAIVAGCTEVETAVNFATNLIAAKGDEGYSADSETSERWEDIYVLAQRGDLEGVKSKIGEGKDINKVDIFNQTALLWAGANGHTMVARVLMDAGADPTITTQAHGDS